MHRIATPIPKAICPRPGLLPSQYDQPDYLHATQSGHHFAASLWSYSPLKTDLRSRNQTGIDPEMAVYERFGLHNSGKMLSLLKRGSECDFGGILGR